MSKKRKKPERAAAAVPAREFALPWWTPFAVLAALLAVYWPAMNGTPLFDDLMLPVFQPQGPHSWVGYLLAGRPFYYLSLDLNYLLAGREPFVYHLTNVLLHALVGGLVYLILRQALELTGSARREASLTALFGSLVFLFHPAQTEAVAYIASRSESLSTLFAYAALALLLAGGAEAIGWGRAILILSLVAAGILTKEHVVAMAAVLPLLDWRVKEKGSLAGLARNWRLHSGLALGAILAVPAIVLFVTRHSSRSAGLAVPGTTWFRYLCTQFKVIWIYLRLFVLPVNQSLDYNLPHASGLVEPLVLAGLAGLIGLLYLAWRFRSRYPLAALGIVVFLILLTPTSSVIPIADTAAERRLYLPGIGLVLVVVEFVRHWRGAAWKNAVLAGVIAALALGTWSYSHAFASEVNVWEHAAASRPENLRARTYLGAAYIKAGRCPDAVATFEGIERDSHGGKLGRTAFLFYMNFASALECVGQLDRAEQACRKAIEITPAARRYARIGGLSPMARGWARLAHLYAIEQRWDDAFDAQKQAAQFAPRLGWMAHSIRGSMDLSLNEYDEAAAEFQQALQVEPGDSASRNGLAAAQQAIRARRRGGMIVQK